METHTVSAINCTTTGKIDAYDATGAAYFIVAVVVVYGLAIMALIAGHIQKRNVNRDEESAISRYLKSGNFVSTDKRKLEVKETRNLLTSVSFSESFDSRGDGRFSMPNINLTSYNRDCSDVSNSNCDSGLPNGNDQSKKVRFSLWSSSTPFTGEISKQSTDTQVSITSDDVFT
ncbi:unnamed protein product [Mytilus coruscus]|uniref:Uncharacterized protein n=1 Tax=Mytilus coruscus TaxID=42192 RepID=A0A6J8CL38_MYTCO|nr:unnamed protein product [Mytilus coruscus]